MSVCAPPRVSSVHFDFKPARTPFARWLGPYSPARGTTCGFRFHERRLGIWVANSIGFEFWEMKYTPGVAALAKLVREHWGGGRVLLLPSGFVIKPLQSDTDAGKRVVIGTFMGPVILSRTNGWMFDMSTAGSSLSPGSLWPGPKTTGIECTIRGDGSLDCTWYHPTQLGQDSVTQRMVGPDPLLAWGFAMSRPGDSGGRVRVTANGIVITNRQCPDGSWAAHYVGQIDPGHWPHQQDWIKR
jgi:hypothetical protein